MHVRPMYEDCIYIARPKALGRTFEGQALVVKITPNRYRNRFDPVRASGHPNK